MNELKELAAKTYNDAYELVIEGQEKELLNGLELAATSLNLWRKVGTPKNEAIGLWLFSRALEKSGAKSLAIEAAKRSLAIAETLNIDWMLASALEALTRATGDEEVKNRAEKAIAAIAEAEDRKLIESQFADLR